MSKWVDAKTKVSEVDFLTQTVPTNMQEEAMVMREGRRVRDEALTSRNVMISCPTTQGRRADQRETQHGEYQSTDRRDATKSATKLKIGSQPIACT